MAIECATVVPCFAPLSQKETDISAGTPFDHAFVGRNLGTNRSIGISQNGSSQGINRQKLTTYIALI